MMIPCKGGREVAQDDIIRLELDQHDVPSLLTREGERLTPDVKAWALLHPERLAWRDGLLEAEDKLQRWRAWLDLCRAARPPRGAR